MCILAVDQISSVVLLYMYMRMITCAEACFYYEKESKYRNKQVALYLAYEKGEPREQAEE